MSTPSALDLASRIGGEIDRSEVQSSVEKYEKYHSYYGGNKHERNANYSDMISGGKTCMGLSPVGVATVPTTVFMNGTILMDTGSRDGVEAWAYLGEEYRSILEHNEELPAFASMDPSPLKQFPETK
ncbi:hypothetical protein SLEP1_g15277 [Rubroshorea leprosula]|uniref:Uncharacterized protein n=1 Tax=Rubroshorea leprosula TaxID=152421 RepID=A0AAV5IUM3_9ROSI|nr:hypothetical protein SLEP1_g15277 [Rubroshorea leprosula]